MDKASYLIYLRSSRWKKIKQQLWERYHGCQICKTTKKLQVHHKTYRNVGNEPLSDLMLLCQTCHYRQPHPEKQKKNWRSKGASGWLQVVVDQLLGY